MTLDELYDWMKAQDETGGGTGLMFSGFDHHAAPHMVSWSDDAAAVVFVVNNVAFCAREDPSDGYRSLLADDIGVLPAAYVANRFGDVAVTAARCGSGDSPDRDTLQLIDVATGKVVLEVGTDQTDSYYPRFIGTFAPEAMAVNVGVAAYSAPKRQPHDPDAPARGINLKGWQHGGERKD